MIKRKEENILGIGFYKSEQWEILKELSEDSQDLENTFEEWLEYANHQIKELKKQGYQINKIPIDVFELQKWCQKNNLPINGESRSQYATELMREANE